MNSSSKGGDYYSIPTSLISVKDSDLDTLFVTTETKNVAPGEK